MRKIIMFNFVTADGYFCGADGDISWHPVDQEFDQFAVKFIQTCDTALFGRVTYDLFAEYWPSAAKDTTIPAEDRDVATSLNEMRKIVITNSDLTTNWQNTETWPDIQAEKIQSLKEEPGKNIVIYGSGTVVKQLTKLGLIDEYKLIIAPVVLGSGRLLFEGSDKMDLKLEEAQTFQNGNVLLTYCPKQ